MPGLKVTRPRGVLGKTKENIEKAEGAGTQTGGKVGSENEKKEGWKVSEAAERSTVRGMKRIPTEERKEEAQQEGNKELQAEKEGVYTQPASKKKREGEEPRKEGMVRKDFLATRKEGKKEVFRFTDI